MWTADVWKSLQKGCLFRGAQLAIDVTLVSALRGDGTAGQVLRPDQVQHSKPREGGRSVRTLNWQGKECGPGSLSSQERLEDGGLPRQPVS